MKALEGAARPCERLWHPSSRSRRRPRDGRPQDPGDASHRHARAPIHTAPLRTHTFRPLKALQSEWEPLALRFLRAGGTFAEGIQPRQLLFRDELKLFSLPAPRFQRAWGPFPRVRITTQQSPWQRRTTSQEGAGARQARVCVLASRGAWAWCPGRGSGAQEARLFEEVIPRLLDPSLSPLA